MLGSLAGARTKIHSATTSIFVIVFETSPSLLCQTWHMQWHTLYESCRGFLFQFYALVWANWFQIRSPVGVDRKPAKFIILKIMWYQTTYSSLCSKQSRSLCGSRLENDTVLIFLSNKYGNPWCSWWGHEIVGGLEVVSEKGIRELRQSLHTPDKSARHWKDWIKWIANSGSSLHTDGGYSFLTRCRPCDELEKDRKCLRMYSSGPRVFS